MHLDAVEYDGGIRFMHAVQEGSADRSYGIQVAQLAGVPRAVIQAAKLKLRDLEQHAPSQSLVGAAPTPTQLDLIDETHPAVKALKAINPDELTPKMALDVLYDLVRKTE